MLSAYPSSFPELQDPFTAGYKVDRLEEIRRAPTITGDITAPLVDAHIKQYVDDSLKNGNFSDETLNKIVTASNNSSSKKSYANVDITLLNALVLYIGEYAMSSTGYKANPSFVKESKQMGFIIKLVTELQPEARYYFINSMVNQLRYPNSHTHYYSYALLHLFRNEIVDQQDPDIQQQVLRVLLERLVVLRPYPWGLVITMMELLKNSVYAFWDLPFIKAAPEVCVNAPCDKNALLL